MLFENEKISDSKKKNYRFRFYPFNESFYQSFNIIISYFVFFYLYESFLLVLYKVRNGGRGRRYTSSEIMRSN